MYFQLGVTAGVLVFFLVFFIATNEENIVLDKSALSTQKDIETDGEDKCLKVEEHKKRLFSDIFLPPQSLPLHLYSLLPLNLISHLWGILADMELPYPFNTFSVWIFATATGCRR